MRGHPARAAPVLASAPAVVPSIVPAVVPSVVPVPSMVMGDVAAPAFPPPGEVPAVDVVRRDPVRALIWRPRPVAVVPHIARSHGVVVALDPDVVGTGLGWNAVRARRRRLADADAE